MNTDEAEIASLKLLSDMQAELRDALNSLGGKQSRGLVEHYPFYTAVHINRAVEGYIYLRESRRLESSKLLVRTTIEAVLRLQAVRNKPELLFRIAFTEFNEDKKWVRSVPGPGVADELQAIDAYWAEFVQAYRAEYPEHELIEKELSLRAAAESSGIEGYYDSHYRLYCRFTHAAFRATTGDLAEFEREDNRTMTMSAMAAIDALITLGATAPHFQSLKKRLFDDKRAPMRCS
jgi:hypothetical protein